MSAVFRSQESSPCRRPPARSHSAWSTSGTPVDQAERDSRATAARGRSLGPLAEPGRRRRRDDASSTTPGSPASRRCRSTGCRIWPPGASGSSISFDHFRFDDWIAGAGEGREAGRRPADRSPTYAGVVPLSRPARMGVGAGRPLRAGRHAARPVQPAAAASPRRRPGRAGHRRSRLAVEIEWVVGAGDGADDVPPGGARPGVRHGPAGRRLRLRPRRADRPRRRRASSSSSSTPSTRRASSRSRSRPRPRSTAADTSVLVRARSRGGRARARLPHVVLAEGRRGRRRQRRPPALQPVAGRTRT